MVLNCWYYGFSQKLTNSILPHTYPSPATHTRAHTLTHFPSPFQWRGPAHTSLSSWPESLPFPGKLQLHTLTLSQGSRALISCVCVYVCVCVYTQSLHIIWQRSQEDLFKELQTWGNEMRTWGLKGGNRKRSFVHSVSLGECGLGTQTPPSV